MNDTEFFKFLSRYEDLERKVLRLERRLDELSVKKFEAKWFGKDRWNVVDAEGNKHFADWLDKDSAEYSAKVLNGEANGAA